MFRVTLICHGLPAKSGEEAARNITNEFTNHRKWHDSVRCEWDGTRLVLKLENDLTPMARPHLMSSAIAFLRMSPIPESLA
jgi:hypothetical protein